jgi:hypothetical protein
MMLHFLIGTAVCIWIAERAWHYASAWRLHRAARRSLQWPPPDFSPLAPRYEPEQRGADRRALKISAAVFIAASSFLAIAFLGH